MSFLNLINFRSSWRTTVLQLWHFRARICYAIADEYRRTANISPHPFPSLASLGCWDGFLTHRTFDLGVFRIIKAIPSVTGFALPFLRNFLRWLCCSKRQRASPRIQWLFGFTYRNTRSLLMGQREPTILYKSCGMKQNLSGLINTWKVASNVSCLSGRACLLWSLSVPASWRLGRRRCRWLQRLREPLKLSIEDIQSSTTMTDIFSSTYSED